MILELLSAFSILLITMISFSVILLSDKIPKNKYASHIAFPSALEHYIANKEDRLDISQKIQQGFENMKSEGIIFTGLVHNLEDILPVSLARLKFIGSCFARYKIIIYENNSTDDSVNILKNDPSIELLSENFEERKGALTYGARDIQRIEYMSQYRNKALNIIKQKYETDDDYKYVCIYDMDVTGGISLHGIAHSFSMTDWDMVSAFGVNTSTNLYYDTFAFESINGERRLDPFRASSTPILSKKEFTKIITTTNENHMIKVNSSFGGCAIYRKECIMNIEYNGTDCEHISLHKNMRDLGYDKIFINPLMQLIR